MRVTSWLHISLKQKRNHRSVSLSSRYLSINEARTWRVMGKSRFSQAAAAAMITAERTFNLTLAWIIYKVMTIDHGSGNGVERQNSEHNATQFFAIAFPRQLTRPHSTHSELKELHYIYIKLRCSYTYLKERKSIKNPRNPTNFFQQCHHWPLNRQDVVQLRLRWTGR